MSEQTEKDWDVWLHNGHHKGQPVPHTRIDQGDLSTGAEAFAFAYSHPEPAVLIVCDPDCECTLVSVRCASRKIPPFNGRHSEVPEAHVHGHQ